MIWDNAELFNTDTLIMQEDGYFAPYRLKDPERSYEADDISIQNKATYGVELRFCLHTGAARLTCRMAEGIGKCYAMIGQTLLAEYTVTEKETVLVAEMPVEETVRRIEREKRSPYGEKIFRFVFDGGFFLFKSLTGDLSVPEEKDLPERRGIVYGSSITAGYSSCCLPYCSYVRVLERVLDAQIENLGFPGVCPVEEWIGRRIVARGSYDFIVMELGVNVMYRMSEEEFTRRVRALIGAVCAGAPQTPVICTDCFPFAYGQSGISEKKYRAFKNAVREAVEQCGGKRCFYIDGEKLLPGEKHLSADGVHPDLLGHRKIAYGFAAEIARRAGLTLRNEE